MVVVSSSDDPKSYAEFECVVEAAIYYDMAREVLPKNAHLVMLTDLDTCQRCVVQDVCFHDLN